MLGPVADSVRNTESFLPERSSLDGISGKAWGSQAEKKKMLDSNRTCNNAGSQAGQLFKIPSLIHLIMPIITIGLALKDFPA